MVKQRPWSEIAESLLIVGSGVGSVASIVLQEAAFASAPLTLAALLSLINRRRAEQELEISTRTTVNQSSRYFTEALNTLNQRVLSLPTPDDLNSLQEVVIQTLDEQHDAIDALHGDLAAYLNQFEQRTLEPVRQQVGKVQEQQGTLQESQNQLAALIAGLPKASKVEALERAIAELGGESGQLRLGLEMLAKEARQNIRPLQEQIDRLNRRINNLPPPFDASALRQDMESVMKVVATLVARPEFDGLVGQVEKLREQIELLDRGTVPMREAIALCQAQVVILQEQTSDLEQQMGDRPRLEQLEAIETSFSHLDTQISSLKAAFQDLTHPLPEDFRPTIEAVVGSHTQTWRQDLQQIRQHLQTLEDQQHQWQAETPSNADWQAFQAHIQEVLGRVQSGIEATQQALDTQISEAAIALVQAVQPAVPPDEDFPATVESLTALELALEQTHSHLALGWPSLEASPLTGEMLRKLALFLDGGGSLDIGWGASSAQRDAYTPRAIAPEAGSGIPNDEALLQQLTLLRQHYPSQIRYQHLETTTAFLVGDRRFAILEQPPSPAPKSSDAPSRRTFQPAAVQELLERFEPPAANAWESALRQGIARQDLGDWMGAIEAYTEAIKQGARTGLIYNNRGVARHALGDRLGALDDFRTALTLRNDQAMLYQNRGILHAEQGEFANAIADFSSALHLEPHNAEAYLRRGLSYAKLENWTQAIADYTAARQHQPQRASLYFHRGLARGKLGQFSEAIADYTHALQLNPRHALAHFCRGLLRQQMGDLQRAGSDLTTAARLFAERSDWENHRRALDTLKKIQRTPHLSPHPVRLTAVPRPRVLEPPAS